MIGHCCASIENNGFLYMLKEHVLCLYVISGLLNFMPLVLHVIMSWCFVGSCQAKVRYYRDVIYHPYGIWTWKVHYYEYVKPEMRAESGKKCLLIFLACPANDDKVILIW